MDTGYDYITPEFLNLIFFQQKSIVIFPYLDVKYLHSLEIFAVGYNIINLDGAAIHNIVDLLEHESYNSYSQNPSLFIISNIKEAQLRKITALDSIHCIININENLEKFPIEGKSVVFYNKKSKKFLNFNVESVDLSFETWLIKNSQNQSILQDKIIKIKSIATQLFTEINNDADKKRLIELLSEYEQKYWDKIIQFTENYYQIEFPQLPRVRIPSNSVTEEAIGEHLQEYELIIKANANFAGEFVKALHEYRSKKVNPANLELMELFSPRKLYCYLRKHHWNQGIPEDFIQEWVNMSTTNYLLTQSEKQYFLTLFSKLNIPSANIEFPTIKKGQRKLSSSETNKKTKNESLTVENETKTTIPSIEDFPLFKEWIINKLEHIEARLEFQKKRSLSK